uniref:Uncharacterized protein n=1 Tax=Pundamilia nyererei TaxID=303518 RepID=A0A3B4FYU3_9CICH
MSLLLTRQPSRHIPQCFLDRTIRSAVEQHLFDVNPLEDQHSDAHESTPCPSRVTLTARQRRRHQREQQHQEEGRKHREKNRYRGRGIIVIDVTCRKCHAERTPKPRKPKKSPTLMQLSENTAAHAVSHTLYSPSLFIFMSVTFSLLLYYYNYYY